MALDLSLVVFLLPFIALLTSILAFALAIALQTRISKIFRSANAPDIERLLKLHTKTLEDFVKFKSEAEGYMKALDDRIKKKTAAASTLRFNPFQGEGVGGNQSFSSVFADEEGNGVVITGMHTRERTNVFAKPLKDWQSEYELTEEEKTAINERKK
jgi:hypothetical protein